MAQNAYLKMPTRILELLDVNVWRCRSVGGPDSYKAHVSNSSLAPYCARFISEVGAAKSVCSTSNTMYYAAIDDRTDSFFHGHYSLRMLYIMCHTHSGERRLAD